jgi:hypothetical protein
MQKTAELSLHLYFNNFFKLFEDFVDTLYFIVRIQLKTPISFYISHNSDSSISITFRLLLNHQQGDVYKGIYMEVHSYIRE